MESLKKKQILKSINLALKWITNSGIQNKNKKKLKAFGAYNAWFDIKKKKYSYMYSEISGYLITSLIFYYKVSGRAVFLKCAKRSADWLIRVAQHQNGGFKCLFLINKKLAFKYKEDLIYAFDNGVIITGLVNLYEETKDRKYLVSAIKSANFIINFFLKKNNEVKAVFSLSKKKFIEDKAEWSMISGSYHTKIAMGFLNLYRITKKKKYREVGENILNIYLKKQKKNGEFPSTKKNTNLHPFCYSVEGYWACGKYLDSLIYKNTAIKSIKLIIKSLNNNGYPPRLKYKNKINYNERVDALAQVLRLIILNKKDLKLGNIENFKIYKLINLILSYQCFNKNYVKENGGYYWGKKSNGKKTSHINTWTTVFVAQTLSILIDRKSLKVINSNPFYLV